MLCNWAIDQQLHELKPLLSSVISLRRLTDLHAEAAVAARSTATAAAAAVSHLTSSTGADNPMLNDVFLVGTRKFHQMTSLQRLTLALRQSTPSTIAADLQRAAQVLDLFGPLHSGVDVSEHDDLKHADSAAPADPSAARSVLHEYLLQRANKDLGLVAAVMAASKLTLPVDRRLITKRNLLLRIALDCAYRCTESSADTWARMSDIFECLPARGEGLTGRETPQELEDNALLDSKVDEFDKHLTAAELLSKYHVTKPLQFFQGLTSAASPPSAERVKAEIMLLVEVHALPLRK